MSWAGSISARRLDGKARVCRRWDVSRSTHDARLAVAGRSRPPSRRGRKPGLPDEVLGERIREVLASAEARGFWGEGYRKVWARLRHGGVSVSKERVRRLMRAYGLQAPHRTGIVWGPQVHDRSLIPQGPNRVWGTDATPVYTRKEGLATVFVAVDHFVGDVVGLHAARPGTRFEALEPIYQGIREHGGSLAEGVAKGLVLRHDHGPQDMSQAFQGELRFLGVESSPSFIRAPEGNRAAERFIRTLKEQLLRVRTLETVEELRLALGEFKERFNRHGLLRRHGYATPSQVRRAFVPAGGSGVIFVQNSVQDFGGFT